MARAVGGDLSGEWCWAAARAAERRSALWEAVHTAAGEGALERPVLRVVTIYPGSWQEPSRALA